MAANALVVGVINIDNEGGASTSALVQAAITFVVIGVVMPRIRSAALAPSAWYAYLVGAGVLPALALAGSTGAHKFFGTPHMTGTTIYLFVSTWVAVVLYVLLKRNADNVPTTTLRKIAQRL